MSAALGNLSKLNCARLHDISVSFTCLLVYLFTKIFLYCDKFTQIMRKAHKSKAEKCAFTVSKCDFKEKTRGKTPRLPAYLRPARRRVPFGFLESKVQVAIRRELSVARIDVLRHE